MLDPSGLNANVRAIAFVTWGATALSWFRLVLTEIPRELEIGGIHCTNAAIERSS